VVAVELASGFLEPLESTSIHFVQASLERLVDLFPTRHMDPVLRDRYNEQTRLDWERVRDFIIAHYHLNQRTDSEFWKYTANMTVPDSLAEVLALWKERAIVGVEGNHLFQLGSWTSVLIGQRFLPSGVHALADRAPTDYAAQKIREVAHEVEQAAQGLPLHHEWLERNAPAPKE
jgi:tryptophan halogenase